MTVDKDIKGRLLMSMCRLQSAVDCQLDGDLMAAIPCSRTRASPHPLRFRLSAIDLARGHRRCPRKPPEAETATAVPLVEIQIAGNSEFRIL